MLIKVRFHGILNKKCPDEYVVDANNAFEAARIVCKQKEKDLTTKNGHVFTCKVKQCKTEEELFSLSPPKEIDLYPSFMPSGGGTAGQFWKMIAVIAVIAFVLIVSAGLLGPVAGAFSAEAFMAFTTNVLIAAASTAAGVALSTWAAHEQKKEKPDQNQTDQRYTFGMTGNTTASGTAIPIGYGMYRVYGQLLSYSTEAISGTIPLTQVKDRQ